jgi:hypothetical protein
MGLPFDFEKRTKPVLWSVDGLIESPSLSFFISKAGVGKSFLVEYLAVCMVYDHDFIGMPVEPCNVLLIDQDTPEDVLNRRLQRFGKYFKQMGFKQKRNLYVKSMQGYSLSDGSLIKTIAKLDNVSLVIIDSLNSVCGTFDANKTSDMSVLSRLKKVAVGEGKALIIVHHISEHADITFDEIMTTSDTNRLTMGNSVINQQADGLFYLTSKSGSSLSRLYVRPVPKRVALDVKPFVARLVEEENSAHFEMNGVYEYREPMYEVDKDILRLFEKKPENRGTYKVFYDMRSKHTMYAVRKSLRKLVERGYLKENRKSKKLFTYELASGSKEGD